uniref:Molybdenum cofactor sulfurase n=1 Tax=Caenorhabditis japonica TaxID=281687 RepID=A0A8R1DRN8_CAEJA
MPSKCQMEEIAKLHLQLFLANPHSHHATALKTEQIVNSARLRVLRHFNTTIDDYFVVFTQNTTHALKIVAECFKFDSENSNKKLSTVSKKLTSEPFQFAYLYDSHHSVIGLRHVVKNVGWSVCLDAASLVSTSSLDLSVYRPNFVAFSFYKMFGFPTGIGALLIRRDSTTSIEKRSFAGGTVQSVDEMNLFFILRENERAYEEGTLNYYAIAQLQKGFDEIERCGGMRAIQKLTHSLGSKAFAMLKSKKHPNGLPVVEIYSQSEDFESIEKQGSIVAFNLKRPDGGYYGYSEVDKMCAIFGLELRTGCFCNVGACKKYLGITSELIMENMSKGKRCGDEIDLINGKPTGAVRISFGRSSTIEDISALEQMTDTCFVESNESISATVQNSSLTMYTPSVIRLFSYPIKSIGSVGKDRYDLEQKGFKNDRMFMIVQNDVTLNFKMHPELCRLKATITDRNELNLQTVYNNDSFVLSLDNSFKENDPKVVCKNT